jgi:hypothetical protein
MPTLDPHHFANAILDEACDIPVDMTIGEWRRQRRSFEAPRPRRRLGFALRRH